MPAILYADGPLQGTVMEFSTLPPFVCVETAGAAPGEAPHVYVRDPGVHLLKSPRGVVYRLSPVRPQAPGGVRIDAEGRATIENA